MKRRMDKNTSFQLEGSRMRKRIGVMPVCALLALMLIAFLWQSSKTDASLNDVKAQYETCCVTKTRLQNESLQLKKSLAETGTEAFIENQARTLYGYMKPDEIRFVITNPEELYGTGE